MVAWLNDALRQQYFSDEPEPSQDVWIGDVFYLPVEAETEVVPIRFLGLKYLLVFISPFAQADHDDEILATALDTLSAKGFMPAKRSRLIKFTRAEADNDFFDPGAWQLLQPGQIFQFLRTLSQAIELYIHTEVEIEQLFYMPASDGLATAYRRAARALATELARSFTAILPLQGASVYAYERPQTHQC